VLEVNPVYFILLTEGFVLLSILLLAWVLISLIRKRRYGRNLEALASRVKKRTRLRGEQSRAFLQSAYNLDDEELSAALERIDHRESEFFQHLLLGLGRGGGKQLATIDRALDKLIESYICHQSRWESIPAEEQETDRELASLHGENEILRSELSVAKDQLNDLISEFGDMFGGGKDHQFALHEIVEMINAMKADQVRQQPVKIQK
jgi:hypothetical protein